MDVYYRSINFLDSLNTSKIEMVKIEDEFIPLDLNRLRDREPRTLDDYQKNFAQELLNSKHAGYIIQLPKEYMFSPNNDKLSFEMREYNKFNHVVLLTGKYLDFAGIDADFSDGQVYAYVSEDNADLVGTEFEFAGQFIPSDGNVFVFNGEEIPIVSTINYDYPVDVYQYSFAISEDYYQDGEYKGYDHNTIFIATNSIDTMYRLFPNRSFYLESFDIFNPTEDLLYEFNSYNSSNNGNIGIYLDITDLLSNRNADPVKLRIESTVIASGSIIIFVMLLINVFQNIKDQHKEFRIHMQFGADYPFIFAWILLYVLFYLLPSLVFIPLLLNVSMPTMLTFTNISAGILLYLVFVFVISSLAFTRFRNTEKL